MSDSGDAQYRYQSMKVIRGRESSTVKKMQSAGWELHTRDQGRLRTEMTFRRVKKPTPWGLVAALAAVAVVAIAVVGGIVALQGDDVPDEATASSSEGVSQTPSETATSPSQEPSEEPTATETESSTPVTDEVLTVENNPDLKTLLTKGEDYNLSQAFAKNYEGRTIEFDGNVAYTAPHGNYDTRFDFLIYAGDYSETVAAPGPSFQFRDVNFYDLNLQGRGSSVGTRDNLHIVAEVGAFEPRSGLFLLEPVSTRLR
ncbi:DUF4839 domain-containing protein [Nocardioides bigeumensis]